MKRDPRTQIGVLARSIADLALVLSVIDGSLTSAKSSNLVISAEAATARLVLIHPSNPSIVGKPLSPALQFGVQDQFGNLVTGDHSKVTLSLVDGSTAGTLTGTTTVTVTN